MFCHVVENRNQKKNYRGFIYTLYDIDFLVLCFAHAKSA